MRALWIVICLTLSTSGAAATMGEGLAAYQRGDYSSARTIVEPLANSGDSHAQYLLGRMHARGEGVLQDFIVAHQWLNLSAARGNAEARTERDRIARQMTRAQIAQAQQLARAWRPKDVPASSATAAAPSRTASSRPPSPTRGPNTGNMVKDIQSMLSELGYDPGPADGVMGRRTRSAIRTYQLHSDLPINGQPSQSLRKALAADLGYAPPDTGATSVAAGSSGAAAGSRSTSGSTLGGGSGGSSAGSTAANTNSNQTPIYVQEAQRSSAPPAAADTSGSAALKALDELVDDGVRRRRADRRVLESLQDLVARYDQPWKRLVVDERFTDGNFTQNPAWQVVSGRFWIGRGEGLRSQVQPQTARQRSSSKEELGLAVLGALLGQKNTQQQNGPATIALPASIGPMFSVETELLSGQKPGAFSLGVYRGNNADVSLRLTYRAGARPSLVLSRHANGRVLTLANYDRTLNLEDGRAHHVAWTRDREGRMRVSVDNRELITTGPSRRRPPAKGFDGLFATNKGGSYGLRFVRIKSD